VAAPGQRDGRWSDVEGHGRATGVSAASRGGEESSTTNAAVEMDPAVGHRDIETLKRSRHRLAAVDSVARAPPGRQGL